MLDAQQNAFNNGYDFSVFLATLGVALDGDVVTGKMSIGCDATERTAVLPIITPLTGRETGLNTHNVGDNPHLPPKSSTLTLSLPTSQKFELDTSLSRQDAYFGDQFTFDPSLFAQMAATTNNVFDQNGIIQYKVLRYNQSRADNPNFYFGPKNAILNNGAASFLFEVYPNYGNEGVPDLATISSFFGTKKLADGTFSKSSGETFPPNWHSRRTPYLFPLVNLNVVKQYTAELVQGALIGGNAGKGNFIPSGDGKLASADPKDVQCLWYEIATDNVPTSLQGPIGLVTDVLKFITGKLNPMFGNFGCQTKNF